MAGRFLSMSLVAALALTRVAGADDGVVAVLEVAPYQDTRPLAAMLAGLMDGDYRFEDVDLADLASPGFGSWVATPPSRLAPCQGEPASPSELDSALTDVEAQLFRLEYEQAEAGLVRLTDSLCACTRPVPPSILTRILYLHGIVQYYAGDREGARDSFALAAGSEPSLEWDTTFPPDAQQVFLLGLADAVRTAQVRILPLAPDAGVRLFVDGKLVPEEGLRVAASRHVVQLEDGSGVLAGAWMAMGTAEEAGWVELEQAQTALRSSRPDENPGGHLAVLVEAARARGYGHLLLITESDRETGWWCDLASGEWSAVDVLQRPVLREARAHQVSGVVLLGAGAALTAVGVAVVATNRSAALELRPEMESSAAMYDMLIEDYRTHRDQAGGGIGLAAAGGACVAVGVALIVRGAVMRQTRVDEPQVGVAITPEGAWLSLTGRW